MPGISVITVNLNNGAGLRRTLESIVDQTWADFECIVVDGGSTDDSVEVMKAFSSKLARWTSEKDNGVYQAMNKGACVATGDYLLFLNSGDHLMERGVLEKVVEALPGSDIVFGNLWMIEHGNAYTGVYPDQLSFMHFVEGSLPHPGSFIKRALFEKLGGYDERLKICSDWKFFLDAICRHNASYKHIHQTIAAFYLDGLSSKPENKSLIRAEKAKVLAEGYSLFMPLYEAYRKVCPAPVSKPPGLVWRIRKRVGL